MRKYLMFIAVGVLIGAGFTSLRSGPVAVVARTPSPLLSATTPSPRPTGFLVAPYPVTDQVRSLVRFVREQVSLTPQHFQCLGCSEKTVTAILDAMTKWVEPRESELEQIRDIFLTARSEYLACEGRIFSISQRLELMANRPDSDPTLIDHLMQDLNCERSQLPIETAAYKTAVVWLNSELSEVVNAITDHLTRDQYEMWAAVRDNAPNGLPMAAWFVPGLNDDQRIALRNGENPDEIFTPAQKSISDAAMAQYKTNQGLVNDAELKFFFGREPVKPTLTGHKTTGECPFHATKENVKALTSADGGEANDRMNND